MSPVKVFLCVLAGIGVFLGLAALVWLGSRNPIFGRLLEFAACTAFGGYISGLVYRGLKNGVISYGYRRESSPFAFWLYIVLGAVCGTLGFGGGVYCLFNSS